ncbi:WXG100 family type VII secretion target [Mycobacteroides abscessus]|uniref:WXG100 family type VII secretion target n=1 Tax=Mycobacteroides abscessus TaxID=36809 RepID=UPI000D3E60DD|nr:WXG100 family type VII secretion target [Mycobacteroides abscessus]PVA44660.1 WXG100 family type VII secretion target [Mycobacteroides abscessus]RIT93269.1 WXG100 family type VII secretion target [Mycobacteroides abscessus]
MLNPNQPLRVSPDDLRMSANFIDMHRSEIEQSHASADASIEEHMTEWVGASAVALQAKLLEWQGVTTHTTGECTYHHAAFKQVAAEFETMDEDKAVEIMRTRNQIRTL